MSFDPEFQSRDLPRTLTFYGLMIAAAVGLFLTICLLGGSLAAPPAAVVEAAPKAAAGVSHPLLHLLLALAAVILLGQALAKIFSYLRQPPVIGEVVAGICLGPSLLGSVWPAAFEFLLPSSIAPSLAIVAQLGVILYMFLVGLELNAGILRKQGHVTLAISHASIVVPFLLGGALALWLYPTLSSSDVPFAAFASFLAVSMSVTAFPVLARILTDRQLEQTRLGVVALACAATDDVSAWCLLALVVGIAQSQIQAALWVSVFTVVYLALMFVVARPIVERVIARYCRKGATPATLALILVGLLLSSAATEVIGIHAIFGAFLFGAMIPHDSLVARDLTARLKGFISTLFLPAFFAFSGMRTQIGLVSGLEQWLICLAILAVASAGKFGGTLAAARWMGLPWRESASLGILMNTRGLMELIVLNIGLDLGIISPTLFAMMVLMALATTMATSPILHVLLGESRGRGNDLDESRRPVAHAG